MTDTYEIARIRAAHKAWVQSACISEGKDAKSDLKKACSVHGITAVLDHIDAQAAEIERLWADKKRLDWLADKDNVLGNIELPAQCVLDNMHSMRAAIDAAMEMRAES